MVPKTLEEEVLKNFDSNYVLVVEPSKEYNINDISFKTVRAYNIGKENECSLISLFAYL